MLKGSSFVVVVVVAILLMSTGTDGQPTVNVVQQQSVDFTPLPYDVSKPPPTPVTIRPEEWFTYTAKMRKYEGIVCEEAKSQNGVYDFLREQLNRKNSGMRYQRILGGLFRVNSDKDGHWFGYCLEQVLSDGNAEAHPLIVPPLEPKLLPVVTAPGEPPAAKKIMSAKAKARLDATRAESPNAAIPKGEVAWKKLEANMEGGMMKSSCSCSCNASEPALATDEPLSCKCYCPPQYGDRGVLGLHGPQGPRGERGAIGRPGPVGEEGFPGRLPNGVHALETCDCYTEDWKVSMNEVGWSECNKPGYLLRSLWRDSCDLIECAHVAQCCRPCLKIVVQPLEPILRFSTRKVLGTSFPGMQEPEFRSIFKSAPETTPGYCDRYISDFFYESNESTCYHKGSSQDIGTRIVLKFNPKASLQWRFRFGAEFDRGAIMTIDGEVVADGSGKSLSWNKNWESPSVLVTRPILLEMDQWHKIIIWGLSQNQKGGMDFEFDNGNGKGWTPVSVGQIREASKAVQNS